MVDWRSDLRALATVGETDQFPLFIYRVSPSSLTPWPPELAKPSTAVKEFFSICDGGILGGCYRWFSKSELSAVNRQWWELLEQYPGPNGGPIEPTHHVILAYDSSGFPVVWDSRTDQLVTFFFKDRDDLDPCGATLDELLTETFSPGHLDDMWNEALGQLREKAKQNAAADPAA